MRLHSFLCCIPLAWGVAITGIVLGITDLVAGSLGWQMVIEDSYDDWIGEFFRKMPRSYCVTGFSVLFYVMSIIHFVLVYGVYKDNHQILGIWLLVNYAMFLFTLVTAVLSGLGILRIVGLGYSLIVVKSHYLALISTDDESETEVSSEITDDDL